MKKLLMSLITLFSLITIHFSYASTNPKPLVDKTINALMQKYKITGAAVELYVDGKPYAYNFGYEQDTKQNRITDNTIFEIGSITKLVTNLLLAMQVNIGKIKLDAPLSDYLSDFQQQGNAIKHVTLENLATYTASLPFKAPQNIDTRAGLIKFLADWKPTSLIGTTWQYSNMSIGLIGDTLEVVLHENYNQMFRNHILLPLHMKPIGITIPDKYKEDYAQGYDAKGQPMPAMDAGLFPAAGAMRASAHDMQLFLKAALSLPGTPADIQQAMKITQTPYVMLDNSQQGLSWEIHLFNAQSKKLLLDDPEEKTFGPLPAKQLPIEQRIFNGDALIDKTGATYGFRTYIAVIPNKKSGIVILTNKYIPNGAIVNAGRKILFALTDK